jgi:hypothetical protein
MFPPSPAPLFSISNSKCKTKGEEEEEMSFTWLKTNKKTYIRKFTALQEDLEK